MVRGTSYSSRTFLSRNTARRRNSPTADALMPRADPDFGIAQPFHAQKQAAPLLLGKALHRAVETAPSVRARSDRARRWRRGWDSRASRSGSKALVGLPRADLQAVIVRHPKHPTPGILDFFALFEAGVEPQEDFLDRLLRQRRMQPERQQIAVNILARFLKQLSHKGLQRRSGLFLAENPHELVTEDGRGHLHKSLPKTPGPYRSNYTWSDFFKN